MKSKVIFIIIVVSMFFSCDKREKKPLFENCSKMVNLDPYNWYNVSRTGFYLNDTLCLYKSRFKTQILNGTFYLAKDENHLWILVEKPKYQPTSKFSTIQKYIVLYDFNMNQPIGKAYKDSIGFWATFLMNKKYDKQLDDTIYFFGTEFMVRCPTYHCGNNICWILSKKRGLLGLGRFELESEFQCDLFNESFLISKDTITSIIIDYYKKYGYPDSQFRQKKNTIQ